MPMASIGASKRCSRRPPEKCVLDYYHFCIISICDLGIIVIFIYILILFSFTQTFTYV